MGKNPPDLFSCPGLASSLIPLVTMPRRQGLTAGQVLHVMNRAARKLRLFESDEDYRLFLSCVVLGLDKVPMRLLAYCVMPNHFHLVIWPRNNGDVGRFMKLVTGTHSMRWHRQRGSTGGGCVYQGRYRAVAVQHDRHLVTVCRYVERNPLRAHLVDRAELWPWSSASQRFKNCHSIRLERWPIPQPDRWLDFLNHESLEELGVVRRAISSGRPIGSPSWAENAPGGARPQGRPKKKRSGGFSSENPPDLFFS